MHQEDLLTGPQRPLHHPDQQHGATVRVVLGVEDQGLERSLRIARRRRQPVNDGFEDVFDPLPLLGRAQDRIVRVEPEVLRDLLFDALHVGRRQVDLVDHRHDLEVVVQRQVQVGHGLGLDPLGGVDHDQRAVARHQRATHLMREIDVPRRVDQVELVDLPVRVLVGQGDGVGLDGDAALALDVHRVEESGREKRSRSSTAAAQALDQAIGQGRLAVIVLHDVFPKTLPAPRAPLPPPADFPPPRPASHDPHPPRRMCPTDQICSSRNPARRPPPSRIILKTSRLTTCPIGTPIPVLLDLMLPDIDRRDPPVPTFTDPDPGLRGWNEKVAGFEPAPSTYDYDRARLPVRELPRRTTPRSFEERISGGAGGSSGGDRGRRLCDRSGASDGPPRRRGASA